MLEQEELNEKETIEAEEENPEVEEQESKTYTQEEFEKELQSSVDKRVSQALKTQEDKLAEKFKVQLEEERELSALTAEERAQEEFDREKAKFEEEKLAFQKAQLQVKAQESLAEKNMPIQFSELVLGEDEESTEEQITSLQEVWTEALNKAVNERLEGHKPVKGNKNNNPAGMSKKEFFSQTYKEQQEQLRQNPDLLEKLQD